MACSFTVGGRGWGHNWCTLLKSHLAIYPHCYCRSSHTAPRTCVRPHTLLRRSVNLHLLRGSVNPHILLRKAIPKTNLLLFVGGGLPQSGGVTPIQNLWGFFVDTFEDSPPENEPRLADLWEHFWEHHREHRRGHLCDHHWERLQEHRRWAHLWERRQGHPWEHHWERRDLTWHLGITRSS